MFAGGEGSEPADNKAYSLQNSQGVICLLQVSASVGGNSFTRALVIANHGLPVWGALCDMQSLCGMGSPVMWEPLLEATQNYKARQQGLWGK